MKTNCFTDTDPVNYDEVARNSSRHLRYYDYKHLKDVDWGIDKSIVIDDIIGLCGFIVAIVAIIAILFLN